MESQGSLQEGGGRVRFRKRRRVTTEAEGVSDNRSRGSET